MQSSLVPCVRLVSLSLHLLSGFPQAGVRMAGVWLHTKARQLEYQGGVQRSPVPDDKVSWSADWPEYHPVDYTAPVVLRGPVWADPDFRKVTPEKQPQFNSRDGNVDRMSHTGKYEVVGGVPRNPIGRTGMIGRGLLGRWGPNHAADPIVSRWKRDATGGKVMQDGKPVLEFVAVKRKDTGDWAIPGGMVDPGDTVSRTLKKEFGEEAMNSVEASETEKIEIERHINELFRGGTKIYAGYADDPRNTDNSWMETVAVNFHDNTGLHAQLTASDKSWAWRPGNEANIESIAWRGAAFSKVKLQAGDDAGAVAWTEAHSSLQLYASHNHFIQEVVKLQGAAW